MDDDIYELQEQVPAVKLVLPRAYISWSQMNCWLTNKARFRKEYFENGERLDTKFLRFGKVIHEMIENGTYKSILPDLTVFSTNELEIRCDVAGVPVLSFIDSYDEKTNWFRDTKTGKIPWTKAKVQKHDQLLFYATTLKWKTGRMPERCFLDWIETREQVTEYGDFWDSKKELNVTGKIITFEREFDEREILRMEQLIIRSANEISEAYRKYIEEI